MVAEIHQKEAQNLYSSTQIKKPNALRAHETGGRLKSTHRTEQSKKSQIFLYENDSETEPIAN